MTWVTISNVRGPRGLKGDPGEGVVDSLRFRDVSVLPSLNVEDWIGLDLVGIYRFANPTAVQSVIGRPLGSDGLAFAQVEPIGGGGSKITWTEYQAPRRTFEKIVSTTAANRTEWKRIDKPFRTVLHGLSMPGAQTLTDTAATRHIRVPVKLFRTIDSWELVFKNFNDRTSTNFGALDFKGVYIGKRFKDANGNYTAQFAETPTSLGLPVLASAGTTSERYRIPDIHYQLEANTEYILSYAYETPGGTPNHMGIGGSYLGTNTGGVASTAPVTNTWSQYIPLDVYFKLEAPPEVPFYVYPGSSTDAALNTNHPLRDGWGWKHAEAHGAIPALIGQSGSTLDSWVAGTNYNRVKFTSIARPDKVIGNPGSNDIYNGATLSEMQDKFNAYVAWIRLYIGNTIEAADVFPRASETAAVKGVRVAFNQWLRSLPSGVTRTYDRASSVTGPDGLLRSDFNSGDNTHLNTAGQRMLAASMLSGQPKPEVVNSYRVDETAGRTVLVWDYLNNREQIVYGDTGERDISTLLVNATGRVTIARVGPMVHLSLEGVDPTSTVSGVFLNLPVGFRPATRKDFSMASTVSSDSPLWRSAYVLASGALSIGSPALTDRYHYVLSYRSNDPWPASLPGVAV